MKKNNQNIVPKLNQDDAKAGNAQIFNKYDETAKNEKTNVNKEPTFYINVVG